MSPPFLPLGPPPTPGGGSGRSLGWGFLGGGGVWVFPPWGGRHTCGCVGSGPLAPHPPPYLGRLVQSWFGFLGEGSRSAHRGHSLMASHVSVSTPRTGVWQLPLVCLGREGRWWSVGSWEPSLSLGEGGNRGLRDGSTKGPVEPSLPYAALFPLSLALLSLSHSPFPFWCFLVD